MKAKTLLLALLIVTALVGLWKWRNSHDPAGQVRRSLEELRVLVSFERDESPITKESIIQKILGRVTQDITLEVNQPSAGQGLISGREEFREYLRLGRYGSEYLRLNLFDPKVTLGDSSNSAEVTATAKADTNLYKDSYWQEVVLSFIREDGSWLLKRVTTVKTWGR